MDKQVKHFGYYFVYLGEDYFQSGCTDVVKHGSKNSTHECEFKHQQIRTILILIKTFMTFFFGRNRAPSANASCANS